ncbi:MAG: hypothetical protein Q9208_002873 [Pyrenodesmia sp. 3 TL-2023]
MEGPKTGVPQEHAFRVLISVADATGTLNTTLQCREIEVVPSLETQGPFQALQTHPSVTNARIQPPIRGVRFSPEVDPYSTGSPEQEASARASWKVIEDICSALCAANKDRRELGFLVDDAPDKHRHKIYRADTVLGLASSSESLENLLKSHKDSSNGGLSRKARLQTAVTLASSVLQLDGSSWLKTGWSSGDIFFHNHTGQLSSVPGQLYPYLAWQPCCHDGMPPVEQLHLGNHLIRSEALLALGQTLIELCFGRTLAEMRKPEDWESDETATRLRTAIRLRNVVEDEMGAPYGDVVRRCLFPPFDVRELSLDIEEVQQMVLDGVVTPLVEDLNNFNREMKIR